MATRSIRLLTHAAGPHFSAGIGHTITIDAEMARVMVADGYAVYVDKEPEPEPEPEVAVPVQETASLEPKEAAVQPSARGRRRESQRRTE